MKHRLFGKLPTGEPVDEFTLENSTGASLRLITLGGIITSLHMPGRDGRFADVVLGFDRLEPYLGPHPCFGTLNGRVAGRIPGGRFTLEGKTYELVKNDGPNHLHGGLRGLDKRIWKAAPVPGAEAVRLAYHSPDGEEGYPGTVDFTVTYTLSDNAFVMETEARADRPTPVSLTQHSYFNLAGEGSGDMLGHELAVHSDRIFLVDEFLTPLGCSRPVAGTAADFTTPRRLAGVVPHLFKQHGDCYALPGGSPHTAARLHDPASGRTLTVSTTDPCLQMYTGAYIDCPAPGKSGHPYLPFAGIALECAGYPAGIDHPECGDILVVPGRPQCRTTRYAFSVEPR
jgi:aldose 1-epimerase